MPKMWQIISTKKQNNSNQLLNPYMDKSFNFILISIIDLSSEDPPFFQSFQVLMQECIFLVEILQCCQPYSSPLRGWSLYIY